MNARTALIRQCMAFIAKEWFHITRDRKTILILLGLPVVQILLFGFVLTNEVKNVDVVICDLAGDTHSHQLVSQIDANRIFRVVGHIPLPGQADETLRSGIAHAVVVIQKPFDSNLSVAEPPRIQILTDGADPNFSTTIQLYLESIAVGVMSSHSPQLLSPGVQVQPRMLYNPQLKGVYAFVPGVMAMILMIICTLMTSVSIVREKELGNMEMLLVSPMHPFGVLFSKTIPYLFLSLVIVTMILLLSVSILDVPVKGNIFLLYFVCLIFILACLSLGLAISSVAKSQQVAMLISLMGLMLPTIMFGGFMFPIENMPLPLQVLSNVVPAKWFYYSINDVMIKGLGWSHVWHRVGVLMAYVIVFMTLSMRKFQIRLE